MNTGLTDSSEAVSGEAVVTRCPDCYSRGEIRIDCPACQGCGKEACRHCGGRHNLRFDAGSIPWPSICPRCEDSGREKCGACHGDGYSWGPCPTCESQGAVTPLELAAVHERKQDIQQIIEAERWQNYEEAARRWDEEVNQWFVRDLTLRSEHRRRQRDERRQRQWQQWRRRVATVACLGALTGAGVRWGPSGLLLARTEAQRYLRPTPVKPTTFIPALRRLTEADLGPKSPAALDALHHELLARRGLKMKRPDLERRFRRQPWYRPDTTDYGIVWERLSPVEQYNLWFIAQRMARRH